MSLFRYLALGFCLVMPFQSAMAQKAGLYLSTDSVETYLLTDPDETLTRHTRQRYSAAVSRESHPRNILLGAEAEFVDHARPFLLDGTLSPKLLLLMSDFLDNRFLALGAGAIIRHPPNVDRSYALESELFVAPHLANYNASDTQPWTVDIAWTWGLKVQANFTLPDVDNAEINLGFRTIQTDLKGHRPTGFDTGIYFGLTSLF